MFTRFNKRKVTEAAALLLKLHGGRMSILKLVKLLYLADREALLRWYRPITTDRYVSMNHGPVVSQTLDLINDGDAPGEPPYWDQYISSRENHEVSLVADPPEEELSRAEEGLLREIFDRFGHWDRWKLVDYTHKLPEWQNPHGSAIPISYRDIFRSQMSEEESTDLERELESLQAEEEIFVPA